MRQEREGVGGGVVAASTAATWTGISAQKTLHLGSNPSSPKTASSWLSSLCGPSYPPPPLSLLLPSFYTTSLTKSPSHDEQSFTGPHLLTYLAREQFAFWRKKKKKSFNIVCWASFAVGRWRTVVPKTPQTHRKRVCHLLHDLSRCRDKAQWHLCTKWKKFGGLTALLAPSVCRWELEREALAVTGRRGGNHISWSDTDTKSSWLFGFQDCLSHCFYHRQLWSFTGYSNSCWPSAAFKSSLQ